MSSIADDRPTDASAVSPAGKSPIGRVIRRLAVPTILAWIVGIAILNTVVPQLEQVDKMRSVALAPNRRPADDRDDPNRPRVQGVRLK